ncbi:MAG: hypothetical protein U9N85_07965 [Bacteroidota bacterium]|nr:hypothetical protein [Bacteroidota bacterium]
MIAAPDFSTKEGKINDKFKFFDKTEKFNLAELFLKSGHVLPKPKNFNLANFVEKLKVEIDAEGRFESKIHTHENDLVGVDFRPVKGGWLSIKPLKFSSFYIAVVDEFLVYTIHLCGRRGIFSMRKRKQESIVLKKFETTIRRDLNVSESKDNQLKSNVFINSDTDSREELAIGAVKESGEKVLAILPVKKIKKNKKAKPLTAQSIYFVLTDKDAKLFGFDKKYRVKFTEEIGTEKLKHKGFWLWHSIHAKDFKFGINRKVFKLFKLLLPLNIQTSEIRMKEIAHFNYLKKSPLAGNQLMMNLAEKTGDEFYELLRLFLAFYITDISFQTQEEKEALVKKLTNQLNTGFEIKKYKDALHKFNIGYRGRLVFLELISQVSQTIEQYQSSLELAEFIVSDFNKSCKNEKKKAYADILYAELLLRANEFKKAENVLKKTEAKLPDEDFNLLLPDEKSNFFHPTSGKFIQAELYELLSTAKGQENEKYAGKLAEIQPLSKPNISSLANYDSKFGKRGKDILSLLDPEQTPGTVTDVLPSKFGTLKQKHKNKVLKHRLIRPDNDVLEINKWISTLEKPKYTVVKSFAKPLNSDNYPELSKMIRAVAQSFSIDDLEIYSAKGKMTDRVVGYEAKPPFIVFGEDMISKSINELIFAVARELAYISHKQTRLTASEAWLQITSKAYSVTDLFREKVSVDRLSEKVFEELVMMREMAKTIEAANAGRDLSQMINAAQTTKDFVFLSAKIDVKSQEHHKVLVAKRLIQVSADRAGLIYAGNLKRAVNALIASYKMETGDMLLTVSDILNMKNNDGTNKYPELAVRIFNMLSFYLSEDYDKLNSAVN